MIADSTSLVRQSLNEVAAGIIRKVCGVHPVSVRYEPRGVMTFKVIAETASGERFVIRFYPTNRSHIVDFEPDLMRIALELGVSVPDVVEDSRTGPDAPMAYVVYRMIDGERLTDQWDGLSQLQIVDVVETIIENIKLLASIRVTGYGGLTTAYQARHTTWLEFLKLSFQTGIKAARSNETLPRTILRNIEKIELLYTAFGQCDNAALAWADISPNNIIVNSQGKLAGLIDFEGMLSGDPVLTLGYLYARYYETNFAELILNSYNSAADDLFFRKVRFFAALRGLRMMRHLTRPLPTGMERQPITQLLPGFAPALENLVRLG